jgi:hypothetical protein
MELTNVHGDEALQISAAKKYRTPFLQERTELGDDRRSERLANSDLTHVNAKLIRELPFFARNLMQTFQSRESDMSQISPRENRAQEVSSSMGLVPTHPERERLQICHVT